jgi:hypothetical protein
MCGSTALLSAGRSAILRGRFKSELSFAKSSPVIRVGVLREEFAGIMKLFFRERREKNK